MPKGTYFVASSYLLYTKPFLLTLHSDHLSGYDSLRFVSLFNSGEGKIIIEKGISFQNKMSLVKWLISRKLIGDCTKDFLLLRPVVCSLLSLMISKPRQFQVIPTHLKKCTIFHSSWTSQTAKYNAIYELCNICKFEVESTAQLRTNWFSLFWVVAMK